MIITAKDVHDQYLFDLYYIYRPEKDFFDIFRVVVDDKDEAMVDIMHILKACGLLGIIYDIALEEIKKNIDADKIIVPVFDVKI